MVSIAEALRQIKARRGALFNEAQIEEDCQQAHPHWRRRKLPPARTLELCAQQVLDGR